MPLFLKIPKIVFCVLLALFCVSCATLPPKNSREALREQGIQLDTVRESEMGAVEAVLISTLEFLGAGERRLNFGAVEISSADYRLALEYLLAELRRDSLRFRDVLENGFSSYAAFGREGEGGMELSGKVLPKIEFSRVATAAHPRALYGPPSDLVRVRFEEYAARFPTLTGIANSARFGYGRLRPSSEKRGHGFGAIEPYYTRSELDQRKLLRGKKLELVWVSEADAARAEAAGMAELAGVDTRYVAEVASNGRSGPEAMPFFRRQNEMPLTAFGAKYVTGGIISTDPRFYPSGALALLQAVNGGETRFVASLDRAKTELGFARAELYLGPETEAQALPALPTKLYFLAPKESLLAELRRSGAGKSESAQGSEPPQSGKAAAQNPLVGP